MPLVQQKTRREYAPLLRIDILSCLPDFLLNVLDHSILKRAQDKKKVEIHLHNLRDYTTRAGAKVDDYVYGGGSGMVLQIAPIERCIRALRSQRSYDEVIYMCPDGQALTQKMANHYSLAERLIILCGHYKGIDERVREHLITQEISIGEYVLTGGELPAAVFCDAVSRLLPGVLGDECSALEDSFQDALIAPPVYTRPADYKGLKVPDVLCSGDEKAIKNWRSMQSQLRTKTHALRRISWQGGGGGGKTE